MRRFLVRSLYAIGCFSLASQALAGEVHQYPDCAKQPSDSEIKGAQGAFQAGMSSYGEADYERAILYWEDAYRRDCTATLLLHHLARAYEGQGNLEQAIVALQTYLQRTPEGVDRPQIQKRIDVFQQKLEDERKRKAEDAERKHQEELAKAAAAPPPAPLAAANDKLYVSPLIPIAVGGVGLVAAVAGSVIYFPAKSDLNDAESKCANRKNCTPSVTNAGNDARSKVNWGGTIAITGLVLAAGGTGWYFFNESRAPKKKVALAEPAIQPWVGTSSAGLLWQGTF